MSQTNRNGFHPAQTQAPAPDRDLDRLMAMEHIVRTATPAAMAKMPSLQAALVRAEAIEQLRAQLDNGIMARFYPLMNSALGFRCDRPNKRNQEPYSINEVRECFIEALLP